MLHRAGHASDAEQHTQLRILEAKRSTVNDNILTESRRKTRGRSGSVLDDNIGYASGRGTAGDDSASFGSEGGGHDLTEMSERTSGGRQRPEVVVEEAAAGDEGTGEEASAEGSPALSRKMSRRMSGPSFSGLSKRLEEKAAAPLKKMKSMRVVANNAVELSEILKEQKVQRDALGGLQESTSRLRRRASACTLYDARRRCLRARPPRCIDPTHRSNVCSRLTPTAQTAQSHRPPWTPAGGIRVVPGGARQRPARRQRAVGALGRSGAEECRWSMKSGHGQAIATRRLRCPRWRVRRAGHGGRPLWAAIADWP